MTIVPIRDMGKIGVITDIDPLQLPANAFTMGVNVRFDAKGVSRGPVLKLAGALALNQFPQYAVSFRQLIDTPVNVFVIGNYDGSVTSWSAGATGQPSVETNITASGWSASTYSQAFTSTLINDIIYLNRPDRVPWYMATEGTQMAALPNWDSTWRCKALRSVAGVLVALNVTKGATSYPTMVKTSDYMTFGSVPGSWTANTTNSATENIIPDMPEALIDGAVLRDRMILYTTNYAWLMEPTYDNNMFSYRRLFTNAGVISQNCVVDVDNTHYVFGNDDIWKHDGFQKQSLANLRVREFIFDSVIRTQSWQCFTMHNPKLCEISFCYSSRDEFCKFPPKTTGCNRAAVYNYRSDTWQFYDLPYVTAWAPGIGVAGSTYTAMNANTFQSVAGAYSSFSDASKLSVLVTSPADTASGVVAGVRSFEKNASLYSVGLSDNAANSASYLENQYIDMDEVAKEIRGYKVVTSLYPNSRFTDAGTSLNFYMGASDYANTPLPVYGNPMTYDGDIHYKLDYLNQGRYMSIKVTYTSTVGDFLWTGLDVDFYITGKR